MTRHEEIVNAANDYVTKTHSPATNEFQTAMNIAVLKAYIAAAKWADGTLECKVEKETKPEPKFKRGDFVFSGIDSSAMKVIDRCYDEHWRYQIFDDVNEYWFFEKELKKVEIGDVVYSKVWKEKVIVREFCDDKFILVADFNGKLLKSLPSLIKQIKEETKPKPSNTVSVDKAAEVFAEMLVELCPELLGFGGAAKEWENEFRKRLEE